MFQILYSIYDVNIYCRNTECDNASCTLPCDIYLLPCHTQELHSTVPLLAVNSDEVHPQHRFGKGLHKGNEG